MIILAIIAVSFVAGLLIGAEVRGGRPRSGVHVIHGEMDPNYVPPSTSLNPSACTCISCRRPSARRGTEVAPITDGDPK